MLFSGRKSLCLYDNFEISRIKSEKRYYKGCFFIWYMSLPMLCWKYVLSSRRRCQQSGQTRRKPYGPDETRIHDHAFRGHSLYHWACFFISSLNTYYSLWRFNSNSIISSVYCLPLKSCYCIWLIDKLK